MNEDLIIICHDEKAQTWDALDISLMQQGNEFLDCIIDYSDYERYNDIDILNLTQKIDREWSKIKKIISKIIDDENFEEYTEKMKDFYLIIEPY